MPWGNVVLFWLVSYWLGWLIGAFFWLQERCGWLVVRGWENFPRRAEKIILIANHPSLWEPIMLYYLFFRQYAWHPQRAPFSLPDAGNYYSKWYWFPFRGRFIPVKRGREGVGLVYRHVKEVLDRGGNLIIFPEGGRTGTIREGHLIRHKYHLRRFQEGAARAALSSGATVVPVWVNGADAVLPRGSWLPRIWRGCEVIIGQPIDASKIRLSDHAFNLKLERAVLDLPSISDSEL